MRLKTSDFEPDPDAELSFRVSPTTSKKNKRNEARETEARHDLRYRPAPELAMPNILRILVVEPNRESRASLHVRGSRYGLVESFANFESARARVVAGGFDYLVTNIRLEAFNGLHLVYLSRSLGFEACALAYTDVPNNSFAADARAAGAAYCDFDHVLRALADDLLGDAESGHAGIGHQSETAQAS